MDEFLDGKMSLRVTYNEDPAPQMRIKSSNGKIIKATSVDDKLKIVNLDVESPEVSSNLFVLLYCILNYFNNINVLIFEMFIKKIVHIIYVLRIRILRTRLKREKHMIFRSHTIFP